MGFYPLHKELYYHFPENNQFLFLHLTVSMESYTVRQSLAFLFEKSFTNPKNDKIPKSHFWGRWGGGEGGVVGDQLPIFDAESKFAKIPKLIYSGGFGDQLPTFDAESKSAKIPKSLYSVGRGGGRREEGGLATNI